MPIKSIQNWVFWSSLVISTLLFVFVGPFRARLEQWLTDQWQVPGYVALVFVSFVALFFLFAAGWVPKKIFKSLPPLRRFVMGDQFIEGDWLDAVFDAHDDQHDVKHVGIVSFKYDNGSLMAKGNDYKANGEWRSGFHTIFGEMTERRVYRYCWEREEVEENKDGDSGYAKYVFYELEEFTGSYTSLTRHTENRVEGDKLDDKLLDALELNRKKDYLSRKDDRTTLIQAYWKHKEGKKGNHSVQ